MSHHILPIKITQENKNYRCNIDEQIFENSSNSSLRFPEVSHVNYVDRSA